VVEPQRRLGQPIRKLIDASVPVVDHITGTVDHLPERWTTYRNDACTYTKTK